MKHTAPALVLAASGASAYNSNAAPDTRRTFVTRTFGLVGASSLAWLSDSSTDDNSNLHGSSCFCSECTSQHGPGCSCSSCGSSIAFFRPPVASAAEIRDVGGSDRSAETAALNLQARQTNARLEASGFKLDSREEEQAKLSSALSSFSYDSNSSAGKSKVSDRGYGNTSSSAVRPTSNGK